VQVARYHANTEEDQRQRVLQPLLAAAEAAAAAAAAPPVAAGQLSNRRSCSLSASDSDSDEGYELTAFNGSSSSSHSMASLLRPVRIKAVRQRVTDLSESQSAILKRVEQRYKQQYNRVGYGRLVTDVIRAVKAWSKYGLPAALTAGGAAAAAAAAAADDAKGPPAYLWEVFVLWVLQQRSRQGRKYEQARPLQLFMDVMQAAAQHLRCSDYELPPPTYQQPPGQTQQQQQYGQEPIILEVYYSRAQALLPSFSALWGCGPLYRPAIIHPVDPCYNCTAWQPFRDWDALAAAAGELHAQLQAAMEGGGEEEAAGGGAGGSGGNAWQQLCSNSSCTLGAAVRAFE
jgi:hypothetical protein